MTDGARSSFVSRSRLAGLLPRTALVLVLALVAATVPNLSGCSEAFRIQQDLRINHANLVDTVEFFMKGWRWRDTELMAAALQLPADADRLRAKAADYEVTDVELLNATILGDEMDGGLVEVKATLRNTATGLVEEKFLKWDWYRVGRNWFIEPVPGIAPF